MRERAIAFDMETERRKAVRIMIFVLVTAFLIFGLMRGTAGSAELKWKFTPSEQVTYDPLKDSPPPPAPGSEASATSQGPGTVSRGVPGATYSGTTAMSRNSVVPAVIEAAVREFKATFNCERIRIGNTWYPCNMQGADFRGFVLPVPDEKDWKTKAFTPEWNTEEENDLARVEQGFRQCGYHRGKIQHDGLYMAQADLSGADFTDAKMCHLDLRRGYLRGTKFVRAQLHRLEFEKADLTGADFSDAVLGTTVTMTQSGRVRDYGLISLNGATLTNVSFRGATIKGVIHMDGAKNLSGMDLTGAKCTSGGSICIRFGPGTDLTGVIWFDGTTCEPGSVEKCLSPSGVDKLAQWRAELKKTAENYWREENRKFPLGWRPPAKKKAK